MLYMLSVFFQQWFMMSQVHPNSFISKDVELGSNVTIGPFCYLNGNIKIDNNTELKSHVTISGKTSIGKNNIFYPFSNIGCDPQDLKFKGEDSELIIGNNNIFRENTTISKGTKDGGMKTIIKNNNFFLNKLYYNKNYTRYIYYIAILIIVII